MNLRNSLVTLFSAILVAACSTDVVVSPMKAPTGPNLSLSTSDVAGSYIVLLKGSNAAGFADKVAALGGTVTYLNSKAGFATVAGITGASAAQLRAFNAVTDVQADRAISLESPSAPITPDAAFVGAPSIESQTNPATAILAAWQWDMALIHAPAAWAAGRLGNASVRVAILDTGIDYNSLDANTLVDDANSTSFMAEYFRAPTHADSILTEAQVLARADDTVRLNFFPTRRIYTDFNGHGTNVASTVSSRATAFAGVSSRTTLMAVKVLGSNGSGSLGTVLSGVLWAADHGADVANMSLGGDFGKSGNGYYVGLINKVFNYAKQQGMLIVVSAGNSGIDLQHDGNLYVNYCDAPHVLCVSAVGLATATGNADAPAFYSNYGKNSIGVAAPGGNAVLDTHGDPVPSTGWPWGPDIASWVWSMCAKNMITAWDPVTNGPTATGTPCAAGNRITGYIGTSQASPHVAGLAALLIAQYGKGNPMMIKKMIENTGDPMDEDLDGAFGRTRINVQRALGL
ncbi:MAG TPA: S8 family serine peptidase [Gemmatimonadaceae bacterium]|nr:S8 family serine peptidase [Gemmatimonadaceae bacterium]